jgi:hypothetical protein
MQGILMSDCFTVTDGNANDYHFFWFIYAWKKLVISINVVLYLWVQMFMYVYVTNIE